MLLGWRPVLITSEATHPRTGSGWTRRVTSKFVEGSKVEFKDGHHPFEAAPRCRAATRCHRCTPRCGLATNSL